MQVRLQNMSDLKAHPLGRIQIGADAPFRVDDGQALFP